MQERLAGCARWVELGRTVNTLEPKQARLCDTHDER